ncbi:hypothetical protein Clacol_002163 [Clathrus columnatus]|uniref:Uncharacterized protein n=1 Tax=Clathrus columnatus TaxID=1419009 RepID=A0AAV5A5V8_9AGAM|nr:hypothetical protein Clacol_002163 [Clathrus columnatus]
MTSVLKASSLPSPPKGFPAIQIRRHRNYCRIWESPEPVITSQQNVCHLPPPDVTQMDVDPKEVSIGTVLQNLPCGAPTSTSTSSPLPLDPLPISNVNDQRSISPILGTNTIKNPRIVSTSPLKISQTSSSTPQLSLPSPSIALPPSTTPLSEDDVHFYASPCPSQSPAHLQMNTSLLTSTGSVPGSYTSGDENNDTCMEDDNENPFIIPAKKVPLQPIPLLLRRRSLTHSPTLTVDGLHSGSPQVAETTALREPISSKHATRRCRPKCTRINYLETWGSGDEKVVLNSPASSESQRYIPIFTGESQAQTQETHGQSPNVDQTKSDLQSTPTQPKYITYYGDAYSKDINMNELPEHNVANYSPLQADYTPIKREPSIIDLTEDTTEFESKPHVLHDAIHPAPLTVITRHKEDHTESSHTILKPTLKISTKPPTKLSSEVQIQA